MNNKALKAYVAILILFPVAITSILISAYLRTEPYMTISYLSVVSVVVLSVYINKELL